MTEIIVTTCANCPFLNVVYCNHKDADHVGIKPFSIPDRCPLIKEDTVIKINVNE